MTNHTIRTFLVVLLSTTIFAMYGQIYTAASIPDTLKENAHSVIRNHETRFIWQSPNTGEQKKTLVITVLNKEGKEEADFICYCDKFTELKKFSGEIYDAQGKVIRKLKKSDLSFTEYSAHLASDEKYYFYESNLMTYPYTIRYEWEIKHKNGLIGFPIFMPRSSFHQSIEQASYQLSIPEEIPFRTKGFRIEEKPQEEVQGKNRLYTWQINSQKAIPHEPWAPSVQSMLPILHLKPEEFTFDNHKGSLSSWNSYGEFQYNLLQGRSKMPPALVQKVREITRETENNFEKVKRLYNYLGENTRYVSIQLGIGGFQPMTVEQVYNTGFGDCKALTNYMMTLLKEIGVESYYTIISTHNSRLIPDFATANQMNHVLLCVPMEKDTLWVECTNPQLPLGYIYEDIAGHDALLLTESGGIIKRLPTYPDSLHVEKQHITIQLSETGEATARVNYTSELFQYENNLFFTRISPREQTEYLRRRIDLPQAKIRDITYRENKNAHPSLNINYTAETNIFGSRTGNRLFIPVNAFRKSITNPTRKSRQNDIVISFGYKDQDTIHILLPEQYNIESLSQPLTIESKFGRFTSSYELEDNKITIYQERTMKTGRYPASDYEEFIKFRSEISKGYEGKIILKKKE